MTELREALAGTFKLLRKHPWLLSLPLALLWHATHTKDERAEFIRRAVEAS